MSNNDYCANGNTSKWRKMNPVPTKIRNNILYTQIKHFSRILRLYITHTHTLVKWSGVMSLHIWLDVNSELVAYFFWLSSIMYHYSWIRFKWNNLNGQNLVSIYTRRLNNGFNGMHFLMAWASASTVSCVCFVKRPKKFRIITINKEIKDGEKIHFSCSQRRTY